MSDHTWLSEAACRHRPIEWWFGEDAFTTAVAVSICRTCVVRSECLDDALATEGDYRHGIRGGLTSEQRRVASMRLHAVG